MSIPPLPNTLKNSYHHIHHHIPPKHSFSFPTPNPTKKICNQSVTKLGLPSWNPYYTLTNESNLFKLKIKNSPSLEKISLFSNKKYMFQFIKGTTHRFSFSYKRSHTHRINTSPLHSKVWLEHFHKLHRSSPKIINYIKMKGNMQARLTFSR